MSTVGTSSIVYELRGFNQMSWQRIDDDTLDGLQGGAGHACCCSRICWESICFCICCCWRACNA